MILEIFPMIMFPIVVFIMASSYIFYSRHRMNNAYTTEELKNIVLDSIRKVSEYNNKSEIVVGNSMMEKNTIITKNHVYSTYVFNFDEGSGMIDIYYFNTDTDESSYYQTINLDNTTFKFKLKYNNMLVVSDKGKHITDVYKSQIRQRTDVMLTYPQDEEFAKFYSLIKKYNLVK